MDGPNRMSLGVGKCLAGQGQHFMRWASDDGIAKLPRNGSESASQSDLQVVANRVFYEFAPFWYMAQTWHCKKNKTEDSQNVFVLKGPLSSKEIFNLYTSRRTMKGSNLIVGVASKSVIQKGAQFPATFFRTLAHIFELAKSGVFYKAITADDIKRGYAQPDFKLQTLPLWLLESSRRSGEEEMAATSSGVEEEEQEEAPVESVSPRSPVETDGYPDLKPTHSSGKIITYRNTVEETAGIIGSRLRDADALFSSAPFWCYLYSHEKQQSRKTPPKTSKEMLQLYQEGCLPGWTPVIGLKDSVAMCNSIPPSLFVPLAALLDLGSLSSEGSSAAPRPYVPIGPKELSTWDKFKDMRGTKGQTAMLGFTHPGKAPNAQQPYPPPAPAGTIRSLRRQFQSMSNIEGVPRISSDSSMAVPHFGTPLSVAAPNPFSSLDASVGVLGGSLPASPYPYSPVPAMYYYIPASPYSMHYPPTHYPYQQNGYAGWSATSQAPPSIIHRHSEPYLPHLFQRSSGLVPTAEENEVEANDSEAANSHIPPASVAYLAPENPPSASGSAAEAGNSSMGSAGIRSILGSVEADSSDSSKWPSSSDGPSMDSVIPQPLSSFDNKDPGQNSRGAKWSTSLFKTILGEDHRELSWWYYCKNEEGKEGEISGPWDSESMLIKVAAEKNLDRVYACSANKLPAQLSPGSYPETSSFRRVSDLLEAASSSR